MVNLLTVEGQGLTPPVRGYIWQKWLGQVYWTKVRQNKPDFQEELINHVKGLTFLTPASSRERTTTGAVGPFSRAPRLTLLLVVLATKRPCWNRYCQSLWMDFKVMQGEEVDRSLFHSYSEELMWWSCALKHRIVTQSLWLILDINCGPQAQSPAECWFQTFTEGPQSRPGMEEFMCAFLKVPEKGVGRGIGERVRSAVEEAF